MTKHREAMPCAHCGGSGRTRDIRVSQSNETGGTGLEYTMAKVFTACEELLADLCTDCGTVVRFYVRRTDRPWLTR